MKTETPTIDEPLEDVDVTWECDICGTAMLDLHCKLRCTNCGFMRDCSDP